MTRSFLQGPGRSRWSTKENTSVAVPSPWRCSIPPWCESMGWKGALLAGHSLSMVSGTTVLCLVNRPLCFYVLYKINPVHECVCVRVCVCMCVLACVCVHVWVCMCACMCVCKLHKLLVCLLCNFCIFNNCSLSFKIYNMCYCVLRCG